MWYLIGLVIAIVVLYMVFCGSKKSCGCSSCGNAADKPKFRTEDNLKTYEKPMDSDRSKIDFDDQE